MASKKTGSGVAVGLGLAAAAAAVAGAYYFYGSKDGAKHRKHLKSWTVKARGEVMEKMESMDELTRKNYEAVISQVLGKYKALKHVNPKELQDLARELKGHWDSISKSLSADSKKVKKTSKK